MGAQVKQENTVLRGDTMRTFKLGRARRNTAVLAEICPLPTIALERHKSETAQLVRDENVPPPKLDLNRSRTTFDW